MQNKGVIRLFAILLALACVYYFSFTYFAWKVENEAKDYVAAYAQRPNVLKAAEKFAKGDTVKKRFYLDSIQLRTSDVYLDSVKAVPVYPVFGFTYEECKEKSINLGLDLRGGMNVTFEISEADIISKLSDNNPDPGFN